MRGSVWIPTCKDLVGDCFTRRGKKCICLNDCSSNCSFKKPERLITNGVKYADKHPSLRGN